MIVRIFRARAHPGKVDAFEVKTRSQPLAIMKDTPGLIGWFGAKPLGEGEREFVMVTFWRDFDALKAYAGEDWAMPPLPDEDRELLESLRVDHYAVTSGQFGDQTFGRV